jgi:hypothetical protein
MLSLIKCPGSDKLRNPKLSKKPVRYAEKLLSCFTIDVSVPCDNAVLLLIMTQSPAYPGVSMPALLRTGAIMISL